MWETFLQSQSRFHASIAIPEVFFGLIRGGRFSDGR
jgi:hypothetical protein